MPSLPIISGQSRCVQFDRWSRIVAFCRVDKVRIVLEMYQSRLDTCDWSKVEVGINNYIHWLLWRRRRWCTLNATDLDLALWWTHEEGMSRNGLRQSVEPYDSLSCSHLHTIIESRAANKIDQLRHSYTPQEAQKMWDLIANLRSVAVPKPKLKTRYSLVRILKEECSTLCVWLLITRYHHFNAASLCRYRTWRDFTC